MGWTEQASYEKMAGSPSLNIFHTLFARSDESVKATVLILHGMQEHSGRYAEFARFLANSGFAVLTYDHPGHGKTAGHEQALGFFGHKHPDRLVLNAALKMEEKLEERYPGVPHFVLGHSMGSFIARCLLQEEAARFSGAIIVGTGGRSGIAGIAKCYFALLNTFWPKRRSRLINEGFGKMNNAKFKKDPDADDTSWLSVNRENRMSFKEDTLNGVPFTNNGFYTLLTFVTRATGKNWAGSISKAFPFLFVSGDQDPIGDFGKGVKQTVKELKDAGFGDVTIRLYPGMRHEILNESIREDVYKFIEEWIGKLIFN